MRRTIALLVLLAVSHASGALAQGLPLLIPAPPPPTPPPLFVPPAVPSVVTPLPTPSYGVPAGVTQAPLYGSGIAPSVRYRAPIKWQKPKRRPRVSSK
jgi:hypothetical protein